MQTANFLAQLWGFSLIIICFSLLFNKKNIQSVFGVFENHSLLFLLGMVNVILGVGSILFYNAWDSSWKTVITAIGWLVLARGLIILFAPNFVSKVVSIVKKHTDWFSIGLVVGVLLGCFLVYMGFNY